jgi:hypothetical protein
MQEYAYIIPLVIRDFNILAKKYRETKKAGGHESVRL